MKQQLMKYFPGFRLEIDRDTPYAQLAPKFIDLAVGKPPDVAGISIVSGALVCEHHQFRFPSEFFRVSSGHYRPE
jgi:hypothetical protein